MRRFVAACAASAVSIVVTNGSSYGLEADNKVRYVDVETYARTKSPADIAQYLIDQMVMVVPNDATKEDQTTVLKQSYREIDFSDSFFNDEFDLSGISHNNRAPATLITRQHVLMASHVTQPRGSKLLFFSKSGERVERTILDTRRVPERQDEDGRSYLTDLSVALLDEPVPATINVYPLAKFRKENISDWNRANYKVPSIVSTGGSQLLNQERLVILNINSVSRVLVGKNNPRYFNNEVTYRGANQASPAISALYGGSGRSSSPSFIVVDGKLALISVMHTGKSLLWDNTGPATFDPDHANAIEALVSQLDPENYVDHAVGEMCTISGDRREHLCDFFGERDVIFGTATDNVVLRGEGPIQCNAATFGEDPAPGEVKFCYLSEASAPETPEWELCASQGTACLFEGSMPVRYGRGSRSVEQNHTAGVLCRATKEDTNPPNVFYGADPAPGLRNNCYLPYNPEPPQFEWEECAKEGAVCSFEGLSQVRYGAENEFIVKELPSPVDCTNSTFGRDPIRGVRKACFVPRREPQPDTQWTICAREFGTCELTKPTTVRYGAEGQYVVKSFDRSITCSNGTFGRDPIVGVVKNCSVPSEPVWTECAQENEFCAFDGVRTVRYGADEEFETKTVSSGIQCSNRAFGRDPILGTIKSCSILQE